MPVPLAVVQGDHTGTRFYQTTRHQHALGHARRAVGIDHDFGIACAVPIDHTAFLAGKVQGFSKAGGCEKIKSPFVESIHPRHGAAGIDGTADAVETIEQGFAFGELVESDPLEDHVVAGRAAGFEWRVRGS